MEMAFWSVLLMAFILGLLAAWISQFTAARKGLEANAKTNQAKAKTKQYDVKSCFHSLFAIKQ